MSTDFGGHDITLQSGEAITQYAAVTMETDGFLDQADAVTDIVIGYAQESASAAGEFIKVRVSGVTLAISEAATNPGVLVGPSVTAGEVEPAVAGTNTVCGICMHSAATAASDIFRLLIIHGQDVTP